MPKPSFDWLYNDTHAGEHFIVTGKNLATMGERSIAGAVRKDEWDKAEQALLANTVRTMKRGDKLVFNMDKRTGGGATDIPSWYDSETGKTTAEILLEYIVTNVAPHLAEQYEDVFGVYYQGETDGMQPAEADEKPTGRLSPVFTESPEEGAM